MAGINSAGIKSAGSERSILRRTVNGVLAAGALVAIYCLATVGATGVMMATTDNSAMAYYHGHGGWHGGGWHGGGWRGRYWHGRWWGPGIGPCWRWTPAGYIWVC